MTFEHWHKDWIHADGSECDTGFMAPDKGRYRCTKHSKTLIPRPSEEDDWASLRLLGTGASRDKVDLEQLDKAADRYERQFY